MTFKCHVIAMLLFNLESKLLRIRYIIHVYIFACDNITFLHRTIIYQVVEEKTRWQIKLLAYDKYVLEFRFFFSSSLSFSFI